MITSLYNRLSNSNKLLFKCIKKGSLAGAFFLFSNYSPATEIKITVLDTGFCPNLIKTNNNIRINPIQDVTRSIDYKCQSKEQLNNRKFHGHWVLSELIKNLKNDRILTVIPIVIFDKYGQQKLSYWKSAFKLIEEQKVDLVIAAAGLPIARKDTSLIKKASLMAIPPAPFLLAAGRVSKGVDRNTLLFPQDYIKKEQLTVFGSYHHGLDEKGPHFVDTSLLKPKNVNYYVPFNFKPRLYANLKGTSLAVALGANSLLTTCLTGKDFNSCLKSGPPAETISAKADKQEFKLKVVLFPPLAEK